MGTDVWDPSRKRTETPGGGHGPPAGGIGIGRRRQLRRVFRGLCGRATRPPGRAPVDPGAGAASGGRTLAGWSGSGPYLETQSGRSSKPPGLAGGCLCARTFDRTPGATQRRFHSIPAVLVRLPAGKHGRGSYLGAVALPHVRRVHRLALRAPPAGTSDGGDVRARVGYGHVRPGTRPRAGGTCPAPPAVSPASSPPT